MFRLRNISFLVLFSRLRRPACEAPRMQRGGPHRKEETMKGLAAILSGLLLLGTACRSVQKEPAHPLPLTGSAEVSGLAQAKDGSPLPGVTVTLVASDGASRALVTDSQGMYHFISVPAGSYMLHFELAGFGRATRGVRITPTGHFNVIGTLNPA